MNGLGRGLLALAAILALAAPMTADAAKKKKKPPPVKEPVPERVVVQITDNDPKRWNLVLNVVANMQKEFGDKAQIEVVAFGPGVTMLKADGDVANRVESALSKGVAMAAGANSMKALNIGEGDLVKRVAVVPSGAVEILKLQREGWSYLKP